MFEKIKKNFGFGAMRLPMIGENVDLEQFCRMVDLFMDAGFNYFDTAHPYLKGQSEIALRECLVKRYDRESFVLTNKLSPSQFQTGEEVRPLFQRQLEACGVDYFDFYLMHAMDAEYFQKYKETGAFETAFQLKAEGKVRHIGFSFHDTAEVLDQILTEYPQFEAVQLQFNYLDMDSDSIQSRACYEVCRKHNKPIIVMEPVKGGHLVKLPQEAKDIFAALGGGSDASYAIRFAASFPGIFMVLSGMGSVEMVADNCGYMQNFQPLNEKELEAVEQVKNILLSQARVDCTGCRYCMEVCPQGVPIPELFSCLAGRRLGNWVNSQYRAVVEEKGVKSSDCIQCGACESACPQHLPIRQLLEEVTKEFES